MRAHEVGLVRRRLPLREQVRRFFRPPAPAIGSLWLEKAAGYYDFVYTVRDVRAGQVESALATRHIPQQPSHGCMSLRWFHLRYCEAIEPSVRPTTAPQAEAA